MYFVNRKHLNAFYFMKRIYIFMEVCYNGRVKERRE